MFSDPLLIVLEYLPYGDLLGYLRKSRGHSDRYNSGEKNPTSLLTAKDLLSFAWMMADGMKYLANMKVRFNYFGLLHLKGAGIFPSSLSSSSSSSSSSSAAAAAVAAL